MDEETRFRRRNDLIRKRLLKYTRKAFRMLPALDKPRVLDIGCGSGVPTLELARLTDGQVTGIDIEDYLLDMLRAKIARAALADRVQAIHGSITEMPFTDGSFDIIWAEGSIFVTGFEKGLRQWRRLLRPGGYLAVHDSSGDIKEKIEQIRNYAYTLLGYFTLDENAWRREYYAPLAELVAETSAKGVTDNGTKRLLQEARQEIEMLEKTPQRYRSAFFVMQKNP